MASLDLDGAGRPAGRGIAVKDFGSTPFLSYYGTLNAIPTRQAVTQDHHAKIRGELYLRLGVTPTLIRGLRVVEFGPGSGENIAHLAHFGPTSITLVDGSSVALAMSSEKILAAGFDGAFTTIVREFDDIDLPREFDLAICEGVIPFQNRPEEIFRNVMAPVCTGGIVIISCADPVSILAESLRRIIAKVAVDSGLVQGTPEALSVLFQQDLDLLPSMTRSRVDWVVDQILQPWVGFTFSMSQAMRAARGEARVLAATPTVIQDWRWYKDCAAGPSEFNEFQATNADGLVHNLLDARIPPQMAPMSNSDLMNHAEWIFQNARQTSGAAEVVEITERLRELAELPQVHHPTAVALMSAVKFLGSNNVADLEGFRPWWGRGQQYLSFCRE